MIRAAHGYGCRTSRISRLAGAGVFGNPGWPHAGASEDSSPGHPTHRQQGTLRSRFGQARSAFSLLEVIIAMAIFLMSIVAIGRLISMGGERALDIEQQGEATMLAQSKLAEVVCGALPLTSQSDQSFDEAPDYRWSLECSQGNITNLWNVTISVVRERSDGSKIECALSQMVLDPAQRGSSQDTVTISGSSGGGGGQSGSTPDSTSGSGNQPQASAGPAPTPRTPTQNSGLPKTPTQNSGLPKSPTQNSGLPKSPTQGKTK